MLVQWYNNFNVNFYIWPRHNEYTITSLSCYRSWPPLPQITAVHPCMPPDTRCHPMSSSLIFLALWCCASSTGPPTCCKFHVYYDYMSTNRIQEIFHCLRSILGMRIRSQMVVNLVHIYLIQIDIIILQPKRWVINLFRQLIK